MYIAVVQCTAAATVLPMVSNFHSHKVALAGRLSKNTAFPWPNVQKHSTSPEGTPSSQPAASAASILSTCRGSSLRITSKTAAMTLGASANR